MSTMVQRARRRERRAGAGRIFPLALALVLLGAPAAADDQQNERPPEPTPDEIDALSRSLRAILGDSLFADSLGASGLGVEGQPVPIEPGPVAPGPKVREAPRVVPRTGVDPSRLQALPRPEVRGPKTPVAVAEVRADTLFDAFRAQLAAGRDEEARETLRAISKTHRRDPLIREVADYDLIEMDFFAARFDTSAAGYRQFAAMNRRGYLTNDAIARILLIDENSDAGGKPLALYAQAVRQERLGRPDSALAYLRLALDRYPGVALEDDVCLAMGDASLALGLPAEARRHYSVVADSMPASPLAATALMRIAQLAEGEGDLTAAAAIYEQVLERFPESVEADEARGALDRLRSRT